MIDLRIAWVGPETSGRSRRIFHDKVGIFLDTDEQRVVFKGSMNETWPGLAADGNLESIDVYASWRNEENAQRVDDEVQYFDNLWHNRQPGVTVTPFPEVVQRELREIAEEARWEEYVDEICMELEAAARLSADQGPGSRTPLPHQVAALEAWHSAAVVESWSTPPAAARPSRPCAPSAAAWIAARFHLCSFQASFCSISGGKS